MGKDIVAMFTGAMTPEDVLKSIDQRRPTWRWPRATGLGTVRAAGLDVGRVAQPVRQGWT